MTNRRTGRRRVGNVNGYSRKIGMKKERTERPKELKRGKRK